MFSGEDMSKTKKKIWIAGAILVLYGLLLLYVLYPRSIVSLLGLGEDVLGCYVLVEGTEGASVDLSEEDMCALLELFAQTCVQRSGRTVREGDFRDETRYLLHFWGESKQFDAVMVSDDNYIFYKNNDYRILDECQGHFAQTLKTLSKVN